MSEQLDENRRQALAVLDRLRQTPLPPSPESNHTGSLAEAAVSALEASVASGEAYVVRDERGRLEIGTFRQLPDHPADHSGLPTASIWIVAHGSPSEEQGAPTVSVAYYHPVKFGVAMVGTHLNHRQAIGYFFHGEAAAPTTEPGPVRKAYDAFAGGRFWPAISVPDEIQSNEVLGLDDAIVVGQAEVVIALGETNEATTKLYEQHALERLATIA